MIFTANVFNGYKMPTNVHETTNFNCTHYRELDIITSMFRSEALSVDIGKDSDELKYYSLWIKSIGKVDEKFGYYTDAWLISGTWTSKDDEETHDFIGFVSGLVRGIPGAVFHLQLHPVKV